MTTDDQNIIEFVDSLKQKKLSAGEFDTVAKEYIRAIKDCQHDSKANDKAKLVVNTKEVRYELLICIVSIVVAIGFFVEESHDKAGLIALGSAVFFFVYDAVKYWKSLK